MTSLYPKNVKFMKNRGRPRNYSRLKSQDNQCNVTFYIRWLGAGRGIKNVTGNILKKKSEFGLQIR